MEKRRVCVVTGSRAEYGLLYWLLRDLRSDDSLAVSLVVTGAHLSPEFGLTVREIEKDAMLIDGKVEMLLSSDTPSAIAKSIGVGLLGFADLWPRLNPDVVVLLGDRYELLAAAISAMIARIPIAHIHGGERTEGVIDEAIRHSISKMSYLHFVAAEPFRRRLIQMGESPERVFNVGAAGLDNIRRLPLLSRPELEASLGLQLQNPLFLVTYHPVTLQEQGDVSGCHGLLEALAAFPEATIVFTGPNADTGGRCLVQPIKDFVACHADRAAYFTNLGQLRYLSLLREVDAVIGNSSSGMFEAPAMRKPTVNIGDRQKGRLRADSILDCGEQASGIEAAIRKALSPQFKAVVAAMSVPFGDGMASRKMCDILKSYPLKHGLQKEFYDLPEMNAGNEV